MLLWHQRNELLFGPLVTKEVVSQLQMGTKLYLYNFKSIILHHFYSQVFKKMVRESSSTLRLNTNEWEILSLGNCRI